MSGRKDQQNEQWGLVGTDGTRATAGFAALPDGDGTEPLVNENGVLWTQSAAAAVNQSTTITRFDNGGAYGRPGLHDVSDVAVTLLRVFGFQNSGAVAYVQLFDESGAAPAGVPFANVLVPDDTNFSLDFGLYGRALASGLLVGLSTTPGSYSQAASGLWLNAEYVA